MELGPHHLRVIEAVASAGSINRAAAHLGLTQPAVSTMLRRVETHFGVRLFVRSPSGVRMTPVGAEVVARARATLACIDDLNNVLAGRATSGSGPLLRVGIQACPALTVLSEDLEKLSPLAQLSLRVDTGAGRIPPLLASGALDIGLVLEPFDRTTPQPPEIGRFVLVEREPAFIGMSEDSPLAGRETIDLSELGEYDWIDDPFDDGPWPAYFRETCAAAGFRPKVRYWTSDWQIASSLIRSGRAIGIYQPTASIKDGIVFKRLVGDPIAQRVVVMWRPEASLAAHQLLSTLGRAYVDLVRAHPLYAEWWDAHPEAHPALPITAGQPVTQRVPGRKTPPGDPGHPRRDQQVVRLVRAPST